MQNFSNAVANYMSEAAKTIHGKALLNINNYVHCDPVLHASRQFLGLWISKWAAIIQSTYLAKDVLI